MRADPKLLIYCALVLLPLTTSAAAAGDVPPVAAFAGLPQVQQIALSPDGRSLAYIQNVEGASYLVTQLPGASGPKTILKADNQKYRFYHFQWVNDRRLLASVLYPDYRGGSETNETRMLAIDSDGSHLQGNLLQSAYRFSDYKHVPQYQHGVLGRSPDGPDSLLVALDIERATLPDVYSLDVRTTKLRRVAGNFGDIHSWQADRQGQVRVASGWRGKAMKVLVRAPGQTQWLPLSTYTVDDYEQVRQNAIEPIGFADDPRYLYAYADHQGRSAIFRIDTADPALARTLVYADPKFDIHGSLIYSKWLKQYVGVHYAGEYGTQVFWNEQARSLQDQLDRALPGKTSRIVSSSDDGMRLLVSASQINQPSSIYWLDRQTGSMSKLLDTRPALAGTTMPAPRAIKFRSRDGTELNGYFTPPWNANAGRAPLVVLPHGGLVSRDVASFDAYTQFLASRGWGVLQVNFRGSAGYGAEFEQAGFKRWGLEMQDDITDGVQWTIAQGLADASRICIVGASYGGCAALMGVVKTPELYRCAISLNGVTDLRDMLAAEQRFINYEIAAERVIGEWWKDRERLRQTSPVKRGAEIRTPLLLIHGKQDRSVPVEQSRDMAEALKDAGHRHYTYLELPLADHVLSREQDRIATFTAMEDFLKRYLDAIPQNEPR
ncbi:S9 family peptidase [Herbaspirillum sp. YR522]|uniref:alpha/beta hydrolase family protein n=1 Tax=Herbaspirillum sp. YR522 TaxID=1144342 RepID=UPI00026F6D84|nr:S9 family peptidase [Herbaspirillum sp. YR522]EJN09367.1 dipeptidyl aminopeptidase/acylaminoacyl peptidase [Herbaspirillum sp. YR522]